MEDTQNADFAVCMSYHQWYRVSWENYWEEHTVIRTVGRDYVDSIVVWGSLHKTAAAEAMLTFAHDKIGYIEE